MPAKYGGPVRVMRQRFPRPLKLEVPRLKPGGFTLLRGAGLCGAPSRLGSTLPCFPAFTRRSAYGVSPTAATLYPAFVYLVHTPLCCPPRMDNLFGICHVCHVLSSFPLGGLFRLVPPSPPFTYGSVSDLLLLRDIAAVPARNCLGMVVTDICSLKCIEKWSRPPLRPSCSCTGSLVPLPSVLSGQY